MLHPDEDGARPRRHCCSELCLADEHAKHHKAVKEKHGFWTCNATGLARLKDGFNASLAELLLPRFGKVPSATKLGAAIRGTDEHLMLSLSGLTKGMLLHDWVKREAKRGKRVCAAKRKSFRRAGGPKVPHPSRSPPKAALVALKEEKRRLQKR